MTKKVLWRKKSGVGKTHAVREGETKTLCGVTVKDDWTARFREGAPRCQHCRNSLAGAAR